MDKPLTPYEQWMVRSNLQTIKDGTPAEEIVQTLHNNGYHRVANAVEAATKGEANVSSS